MEPEMTTLIVWMVAIALYVGSCYLAGWAATERGRSGGWFVIALFLTPVISLLALIAAGPKGK